MDKEVREVGEKKFSEKEYYREKIIEMVQKINNQGFLFKIYHYILVKYKMDSKWEETEV